LRERAVFTAAGTWRKCCPIRRTGFALARFSCQQIVLDIWGGSFANIAANLNNLPVMASPTACPRSHWQRSGYDNALPMHYPANARMG